MPRQIYKAGEIAEPIQKHQTVRVGGGGTQYGEFGAFLEMIEIVPPIGPPFADQGRFWQKRLAAF